MRWTSVLAIYLLFWTISVFLVIPFGVRTHEEAGAERVPGQAESAPHGYSIWRTVKRATIVSVIVFGLFYLNYLYGWVSVEDITLFHPPAN